jgi:hypothetical protein
LLRASLLLGWASTFAVRMTPLKVVGFASGSRNHLL